MTTAAFPVCRYLHDAMNNEVTTVMSAQLIAWSSYELTVLAVK